MTASPDNIDRRPAEPLPVQPPGAVDLVRAEEQLQVGHDVHVSGRAVLRKYVVTETVTQTFQVRHEEVRLDVEPVDRSDSTSRTGSDVVAGSGVPFDGHVVEVVLHREVPVVHLQVEATERVRLHVDTLVEQVPVSADLRAERIELEEPGA